MLRKRSRARTDKVSRPRLARRRQEERVVHQAWSDAPACASLSLVRASSQHDVASRGSIRMCRLVPFELYRDNRRTVNKGLVVLVSQSFFSSSLVSIKAPH